MAPRLWKGHYRQFETNTPMEFQNFDISNGLITAKGQDEVGAFEINGTVQFNQVAFLKQYIGQHQIFYKGTLEDNRITGHWGFALGQQNRDTFQLSPI